MPRTHSFGIGIEVAVDVVVDVVATDVPVAVAVAADVDNVIVTSKVVLVTMTVVSGGTFVLVNVTLAVSPSLEVAVAVSVVTLVVPRVEEPPGTPLVHRPSRQVVPAGQSVSGPHTALPDGPTKQTRLDVSVTHSCVPKIHSSGGIVEVAVAVALVTDEVVLGGPGSHWPLSSLHSKPGSHSCDGPQMGVLAGPLIQTLLCVASIQSVVPSSHSPGFVPPGLQPIVKSVI